MRQACMSIVMAYGTYAKGMTRVTHDTQPGDPGAC
jgi:hypothetical protein